MKARMNSTSTQVYTYIRTLFATGLLATLSLGCPAHAQDRFLSADQPTCTEGSPFEYFLVDATDRDDCDNTGEALEADWIEAHCRCVDGTHEAIGSGGAGAPLIVEEDNVTVDGAATNLDITEPDATVVTSSPAGEANLNLAGYVRYGGRPGNQTIYGGAALADNLLICASDETGAPCILLDGDGVGESQLVEFDFDKSSSTDGLFRIKLHSSGGEVLIGHGASTVLGLGSYLDATIIVHEAIAGFMRVEGGTADAYEGTFAVSTLTGDHTWTFPDWTGTVATKTQSATLPGTCTEGEMYQDTDAGGSETYICTATDTWVKLLTETGGFHGVRVSHSTTQSTTTATWARKNWDTEQFDSDGYHDTVTENQRITIPTGMAGWYAMGCSAAFAFNTTGIRYTVVTLNSATTAAGGTFLTTSAETTNAAAPIRLAAVTTIYYLEAGDEIQCHIHQNSGGNLNTVGAEYEHFYAYLLTAPGGGGATNHYAEVYNSTTQSINNTTETAITYNTETSDTDGYHSTSSNTSRFTIPAGLAGDYVVGCTTTWASGVFTLRYAALGKNGTVTRSGAYDSSDGSHSATGRSSVTDFYPNLVAGDYIECFGYQNSGGSLNANTTTTTDRFWILKVGGGGDPDSAWKYDTTSGSYYLDLDGDGVFDSIEPSYVSSTGEAKFVNPNAVLVYGSGTFSHNTSGSYMSLTWDSEARDPSAMHNTGSNTERLTVSVAGFYNVSCGFKWDANTTNGRGILIDHLSSGGSTLSVSATPIVVIAAASQPTSVSGMFEASVGDYFRCRAYQASGGTRTPSLTRADGGFFGAYLVAR